MPQSVPTPVAAALGLVPAVLSGVRRLPGRAVQLPVLAVGSALSGLDAARREYDDLAARGERLIARLRGTSFDELEDRFEDALQDTPLARPYDAVEDALEDAGEAVSATVSNLSGRVAKRTGRVTDTAEQAVDTAEQAGSTAADKADTAAKAVEKAAAKAAKARKAVDEAADKVADAAEQAAGTLQDEAQPPEGAPVVVEHDDLPLPDYDHMTLGSLRGRLRSLTVEQLVQVRDYERAHANRLPVVTMLDNRIAKLATDAGAAQPSGVPSDRPAPGQRQSRGGSKVSPATDGPVKSPPPAGMPTDPS